MIKNKLLSAIALISVLACSSEKQGTIQGTANNGESENYSSIIASSGSSSKTTAINVGGYTTQSTSLNSSGGTSSVVVSTIASGGTVSSLTTATTDIGYTGDPILSTGGSGTTDDPISTGGSGSTGDPIGGSGNTADPNGGTTSGGNGSSADPIGGNGNTSDPAGGSGSTGDPSGGSGSTGDPTGGTGNTGDPVCVPTEMNNVNVIVFNDASPTGADSEGAMYVGNNLTSSSYSVGAGTLSGLTCSDWGLVVGNNIVGSAIVKDGKLAYGGTTKGTSTSTCGVYHALPIDFATLESKFISYSQEFEKMAMTGTVSGSITFTGTSTTLNVFDITSAQLTAASLIAFNVPVSSSVVINVSGINVNWSNVGFSLPDGGASCRSGSSAWCSHILWNFYEATSIKLSSIGVQGSILAPYATQSGSGGNVDGQVVVLNLTGGIEYHPYYFSGCLYL